MTDFIRTIWQTTAATSANASARPVHVKTEVQPVDQIRLPPQATPTSPMATNGLVLEKQRLVKLELESPDSAAGKAQRAARRDVVNARRDKRKSADVVVDLTSAADGHGSVASKKQKTGDATATATATATANANATANAFAVVATSLTPELDPSGEERLRLMEAQLEHLDPDSKEAKKKRRLIRNRMSAQLHRERKKAYVGQLEDQLQAKEQELKQLQEQMAAMAMESAQLKQRLVATPTATAPANVAIKTEPQPFDAEVVSVAKAVANADAATATDASTVDNTLSDNWAACLDSLDEADSAMNDEDLLCGLDDSVFAAYDSDLRGADDAISADPLSLALAQEVARQAEPQPQTHHEIHAAKKNLAMMMAMMFSVTFCGQSPSVASVTSGSSFASMFNAVPVKELSQMSVASRLVACLEKTSWKDFQDVSSWTASAAAGAAAAAVAVAADGKKAHGSANANANANDDANANADADAAASPSAASDTTDVADSCDSPAQLEDVGLSFDTDLLEEFVYPVDESFAPSLADTTWFGSEVDTDRVRAAAVQPVSMTSRLYEKLTKLWHEKSQVLLTVLDCKNEVTRRSVADMSTIRKGLASGKLFPTGANGADEKLVDGSVTFLYPLSAFSEDQRAAVAASADPAMFLEVSCQLSRADE